MNVKNMSEMAKMSTFLKAYQKETAKICQRTKRYVKIV